MCSIEKEKKKQTNSATFSDADALSAQTADGYWASLYVLCQTQQQIHANFFKGCIVFNFQRGVFMSWYGAQTSEVW